MKIYSRRGKKIMVTKNKRHFRLNKVFLLFFNEGRGRRDINANWENEIKIVLENQMIQKRSEEIKKSQKH